MALCHDSSLIVNSKVIVLFTQIAVCWMSLALGKHLSFMLTPGKNSEVKIPYFGGYCMNVRLYFVGYDNNPHIPDGNISAVLYSLIRGF